MVVKKKFIKEILDEYWKGSCAVCGLETPPVVESTVEDFILSITVKCPNCGLTITYKDHNEIHLPSTKNLVGKMKLLISNAIF